MCCCYQDYLQHKDYIVAQRKSRFAFRCGIRMLELAAHGEYAETYKKEGHSNRVHHQLASALKNLGVVYVKPTD